MSRTAPNSIALGDIEWTPAPTAERIGLATEEIHIWRCNLGDCATANILSEDEQARAKRFTSRLAQARFVASRVFLRVTLSRYLDQPANTLPFAVAPSGKPSLDNVKPAPEFNLSHTGDLALLAVAEHPIGVDVERESARNNLLSIAERVFQADDVAILESAENPTHTFVRLWTRYEARQKAFGEGIFGRRIEPAAVRSVSFSPGDAYYAAVAVADMDFVPVLHFFDFPVPP